MERYNARRAEREVMDAKRGGEQQPFGAISPSVHPIGRVRNKQRGIKECYRRPDSREAGLVGRTLR